MLKITCALCLFLFACGGQASTRPTLRSGTSSANPALAPTSTAQVRAPDAAPQRDIDLSGLIALTEAEAARGVRPAVNGLGADLFARVASTRGNVAFSPASIAGALALLAAGARGQTLEEMLRVLHADDTALDGIGRAMRGWDDSSRETFTLRVVNRLFADTRYTFEPAYVSRMNASFPAPAMESLDFVGASDHARVHINDWVRAHTGDVIEELFEPRSIAADTRIAVASAIYLNARWRRGFEHETTRPGTFKTEGGRTIRVPTMHATYQMAHGELDGATIIELPYVGDDLAMRFVLPPEGTDPAEWATEAHLSDQTPLRGHEVELSLPKFEMKSELGSLSRHLRALGMVRVFDEDEADLSGLARHVDEDERLYLSALLHTTYLRVDEDGTEAAAATGGGLIGIGGPPPRAIVVRFDRPFLCVLRDVRSGAVLFLARISDPR